MIAADALAAGDFRGMAVRELCGPHDLTMAQAVHTLGVAIGKPELPYLQTAEADFAGGLTGAGFSRSAALAMVEMGQALSEGLIRHHQPRTPRTTGTTPFERFAQEFAEAYRAA